MKKKTVLITDYAWPTLDPEREILERAGAQLLVAENGSIEELEGLAPQADAIFCNWKPVSESVLRAARRCVTVGRYGIGLDNIDVPAATGLGIVVTNMPAYCVNDVADHTMSLLLACTHKICSVDRDIKAGRYDLKAQLPLQRLRGHTLGLIGFGRIGRAVAERALAFGLRVIALSPRVASARLPMDRVEFVDLPDIFEQSDYLSLHIPATPSTAGMFSRAAFGKIKHGTVLINTARGSLICAADLIEALDSGRIAAAGIDVWPQEPVPPGDLLACHPHVIATPHSAFYSEESLLELQRTAASQVVEVFSGRRPQNVVNAEVLHSPDLRAHFL